MFIFSDKAIEAARRGVERGAAERGPFDVQLLPVDYCNIRCGFCPLHAIPRPVKEKRARRFITDGKRMEWRLFSSIVDGLNELGGVERVHFTGGEPLLHPRLPEMAAAMKRRFSDCSVIVVSNGTLLKGKAEELVKAGIDRLSLSINSASPSTRMKISPGEPPETLDKIIDGMMEFKDAVERGDGGDNAPELVFSSVLTNLNCREAEAQLALAEKTGAGSVTFLPLTSFEYDGKSGAESLQVSTEQFRAFMDDLARLRPKAEKAGIWLGYAGSEDDGGALSVPKKAQTPCYTGFSFAMFWPDGSVRPCCNCEEPMGNLFRRSLAEIWRGAKYSGLRMKLLQPREADFTGCSCHECGYMMENREIHSRL